MLKNTPELIQPEIDRSLKFILECFAQAGKTKAVVAVSGGIDSAVTLTLVTKALGAEAVTAVLLPYGDQDMTDAMQIAEHNQIPADQILTFNIAATVAKVAETVGLDSSADLTEADKVRLGNIMARTRMIMVFDLAKKINGLVCGTENLTEHYLGYFTRFGDAASDLEPITAWFKTEVRAVAEALKLPTIFTSKAPSAGLWQGQTDEAELGFSYEQADKILEIWRSGETDQTKIVESSGESSQVVEKVISRVKSADFKHHVPYKQT